MTFSRDRPRPIAALVFIGALTAPSAGQPARAPRPGVKPPGIKIPIERLKPEAIFEVPGAPDWIVVDQAVWVSNSPKNTVARLDPKKNNVVEFIAVGQKPCSGIAAGFDSIWVPNCGDGTLSR